MATVEPINKYNKKRRKGRGLKFLVSVILLAAVSVVAAVLIMNNGKLTAEGFSRLFSNLDEKTEAASFLFDAGPDADLASFGGGLAVATTNGLQVFDRYGDNSFSDTMYLASPTLVVGGNAGAAYDLGGRSLALFNTTGVIKSITTKGNIISACLNSDGWLALCTQESGFKGLVTVYNAKGDEVYYWKSANGYTLSAEVSPKNRELAILTLTEDGSRIVFFALNSTDEKSSCTFSGTLVTDIAYIDGDSVLAVSEDRLAAVHEDGACDTLIDYTDKYLAGYSTDGDGFTALVLNDYLVGEQGGIVTVDRSGKTLGTLATDRKVLSLSAGGDYLAVLYSDRLVIYKKNLEECASYDDTAGAVRAIMRPDGTALVVTAHSAEVRDAHSD
jgi:hypothetical protein